MILKVSKTHEEAILPSRSNPSDAGADVFWCPPTRTNARMQPGDSRLFSTGLKIEVPTGYMLEVKNRSSMAAKKSLVVGACVVDSGYDGEVFVNLHNIGTEPQVVEPHTKIAQVVMTPVVSFRALETQNPDLYGWYPITISDRGDGALGSTDAKDS